MSFGTQSACKGWWQKRPELRCSAQNTARGGPVATLHLKVALPLDDCRIFFDLDIARCILWTRKQFPPNVCGFIVGWFLVKSCRSRNSWSLGLYSSANC